MDKEQLIHHWKVATVRKDDYNADSFRDQLNPILKRERREKKEKPVEIEQNTTKPDPIIREYTGVKFPEGEFTVKTLLDMGYKQPGAGKMVNEGLKNGVLKVARLESAGRGRPQRILVKV